MVTVQVYVTSKLKIKLLCFFNLQIMVQIFSGVEKRCLPFSCTKIRNISKRAKTSLDEVMQPITSNKRFATNCFLSCPQPDRFLQAQLLTEEALRISR